MVTRHAQPGTIWRSPAYTVCKSVLLRLVHGGMVCGAIVLGASALSGCSAWKHSSGVRALDLTPKEWASLGQPGSQHQLLQQLVGAWRVRITFWSSPESKGQVSHGTSESRWVLGGRFIQENFTGKVEGEPYTGMGMIGYDNGARGFKTVWLDSFNTSVASASGSYVEATKTFELVGEVYDPMRGGLKEVRSTIHLATPDSYIFSMYDETPTGRRFKSFEMYYSREARQSPSLLQKPN